MCSCHIPLCSCHIPAQRQEIDSVHGTAVPSPGAGVSLCEVVVEEMGAIATAVVIADQPGAGSEVIGPLSYIHGIAYLETAKTKDAGVTAVCIVFVMPRRF